jgi:hypothetical protein
VNERQRRHLEILEPRDTSDADKEAVFSRLSRSEKAFLLADDFVNGVHFDGFHLYFHNTNCRYAHETWRGLILLGFAETASLLRRAIDIAQIPDPLPSDYAFDSGRPAAEDSESLARRLGHLDREFCEAHRMMAIRSELDLEFTADFE